MFCHFNDTTEIFLQNNISVAFEIYLELFCDRLCVVPPDMIIEMLVCEYIELLKKWFNARPINVEDHQSSQKPYRVCPIDHQDM